MGNEDGKMFDEAAKAIGKLALDGVESVRKGGMTSLGGVGGCVVGGMVGGPLGALVGGMVGLFGGLVADKKNKE